MSIKVENLSYVYMKNSPFEKAALKNINLTIESGEFVGIIGRTGSGKSTLVQHFNGLLKPTSGKVVVNGMDTSGRSLKELRRQVGIVFQYPEHQLFEETVYMDIAFGPKKQGLEESEVASRVKDALELVGLPEEFLEKSPFELSGGQKRRVAIAGVIATNPRILVLDEPAAGLDPRGRDEILGFVSELHRESGITIILVSHNMEDVARLAERIVVMNEGGIEMDGKPRDIFPRIDRLEQMGLSAPQVSYLMRRLKAAYPGINANVFTISDAKKELLKYLK